MDYEIAIIGGGVVGLACAAELSKKSKSVLLIERHPNFGYETSSRNSEVIHAGIYYPQNSLKAKLCVPGNRKLYEWCSLYDIPHKRIGKYIVAVARAELSELDETYKKAKNNGVSGIVEVSIDRLHEDEPNVRAVGALLSTDTGIVDTHKLMESLCFVSKENGCDFAWKHTLTGISRIGDCFELELLDPEGNICKITSSVVVNSAGLDSDKVAEMAGIDADEAGYRLNYCRGHYFRIVSSKKNLVSHLIYPVPQKNVTSLGIHVTPDMNGELKLGPDAEYLIERKQDYSVPADLQEKFYRAASRYLNGLNYEDIYPDQAGIRPKLQTEGGEFRDFIIIEESDRNLPGLINLIGIESPGLTSCLEIAEMVVGMIY